MSIFLPYSEFFNFYCTDLLENFPNLLQIPIFTNFKNREYQEEVESFFSDSRYFFLNRNLGMRVVHSKENLMPPVDLNTNEH